MVKDSRNSLGCAFNDTRNPLDSWSKACADFGAYSRNPLGCAFNDSRNSLDSWSLAPPFEFPDTLLSGSPKNAAIISRAMPREQWQLGGKSKPKNGLT